MDERNWMLNFGFHDGTCFVVWGVFHIYLWIYSNHRVGCINFTLFFWIFSITVLDTSITSETLHFAHYILCNWCRYALRSSDLLCLLVDQTRRNGEPKHGWNVNDDVSLPVPKCEVEVWSTVATPYQPQQVNFWVHMLQIVMSVLGYIWETCCGRIGSGPGFAPSSCGFPKLTVNQLLLHANLSLPPNMWNIPEKAAHVHILCH
jgi:hypothetical protein